MNFICPAPINVEAPSINALAACSSLASAVSPVIDVALSIVFNPYSAAAVVTPATPADVQNPALVPKVAVVAPAMPMLVPKVATVVAAITGASIIPIFAISIVESYLAFVFASSFSLSITV